MQTHSSTMPIPTPGEAEAKPVASFHPTLKYSNKEEKELAIALKECDLILTKAPSASPIDAVNFATSRLLKKDLFIHEQKLNKKYYVHLDPDAVSKTSVKKYLNGWSEIDFIPFAIRNYLYILHCLIKKDFSRLNESKDLKTEDNIYEERITILKNLLLATYECLQICLQIESRKKSLLEITLQVIRKLKKIEKGRPFILSVGPYHHQIYLLIEKINTNPTEKTVLITIADTYTEGKYSKNHRNFPGESFIPEEKKSGQVIPRIVGIVNLESPEHLKNLRLYLLEVFKTLSSRDSAANHAVYDTKSRLKKPDLSLIPNKSYVYQEHDNCVVFNWNLLVRLFLQDSQHSQWLNQQEKACADLSIHNSLASPPLVIEKIFNSRQIFRMKILFQIIKEAKTSYLDFDSPLSISRKLKAIARGRDPMSEKCKEILRVDLSGQNITDENIGDIIFVLKLLPNARLVNLSANELSVLSRDRIINFLEKSRGNIQTLYLSHNLMDTASLSMIEQKLNDSKPCSNVNVTNLFSNNQAASRKRKNEPDDEKLTVKRVATSPVQTQ